MFDSENVFLAVSDKFQYFFPLFQASRFHFYDGMELIGLEAYHHPFYFVFGKEDVKECSMKKFEVDALSIASMI